jgi:hypothetical protein
LVTINEDLFWRAVPGIGEAGSFSEVIGLVRWRVGDPL